MSNINHEYIKDYLLGIIPESEEILRHMEEYAVANNVPIITKDVAELIKTLIKISSAKNILEVGTAIGYSSILMGLCCDGDFSITTIERNADYIEIARDNIAKAGLSNRIKILYGDAEEVLKTVQGKYDLIFIDAAKGQYMDFFKLSADKLKIGGLFICDNVLFRGMVAERSLLVRRKITIVKRLKVFLSYISNNKAFQTTVIPIGDGVSLSCKLKEVNLNE